MKRFILLLLFLVLGLSLCACSDDESDKMSRLENSIAELEDDYNNAKQKADQFSQDVNDYYDALDELEKYN